MNSADLHGGNIYGHTVRLDFSVSLHPLGMPRRVEDAIREAAQRQIRYMAYPQYDSKALTGGIREFLQVMCAGCPQTGAHEKDIFSERDRMQVLAGNGASELLMAVCQTLRPARTVILVPSFYGYERACRAVGSKIVFYGLRQETGYLPGADLFTELSAQTDLLILASPNNPTGRLPGREYLLQLLQICAGRGITVLLDESFIGFCKDMPTMLDALGSFDNLLILGSFTKLFSIPGIRLGYLCGADPALMDRIRENLPEWNVSSAAQQVGLTCVQEKEWIRQTCEAVRGQREYLQSALEKLAMAYPSAGLRVFGSDANFLMLRCDLPLYELLLDRGILIRDLAGMRGLEKGFYRIGIREKGENEQLLQALEEVLQSDRKEEDGGTE